jgi:hypothetical protein
MCWCQTKRCLTGMPSLDTKIKKILKDVKIEEDIYSEKE